VGDVTTTQLGGTASAIGLTIRERRIALDLTKAEAARRAGVSRRTWHEIEDGLRSTSSAETLGLIDQVLGLPDGTLFAMTARSAHDKVEALRAQAIEMVRLMSSDELQTFVDCHGADTVQTLLGKLDASIESLRREFVGRSPNDRRRGARSA
jgi:transcriptional regulator with XRE-family HTH domain